MRLVSVPEDYLCLMGCGRLRSMETGGQLADRCQRCEERLRSEQHEQAVFEAFVANVRTLTDCRPPDERYEAVEQLLLGLLALDPSVDLRGYIESLARRTQFLD